MIGTTRATVADLPQRLQHLATAVELATGRLDPDVVQYAEHVRDKADARMLHGTTHTVAALLGATGSGKSSMANALIGSTVATTGVRRPTTSTTLACVFGSEDATPLLDWLEIPNRHLVSKSGAADDATDAGALASLDGLVLLDVPDHDSVAVAHRLEMERIAEHADLLLWVTDPEKYADAALHRYLQLLDAHGAVTVMVLNKADTLSAEEAAACQKDLRRLLTDDGIGGAQVFLASASTGAGIPDLRDRLAELVAEQTLALERLEADVVVAASDLAAEVGPPRSASVAKNAADRLTEELIGASGLHTVADAVARGHKRDAVQAMGWPVTKWVRKLRPHPLKRLHLGSGTAGRTSLPAPSATNSARVVAAVRQAADDTTADLNEPWPTLVRNAALPSQKDLHAKLDAAVGDAAREVQHRRPRWWAPVTGLQRLLALAMLVGLGWLVALAVAGFFALGDIPIPEIGPVPIPTGLALGGALFGVLVAALARRLASVGASRRARKVERNAKDHVASVASEMVIDPLVAELDVRDQLTATLRDAGAKWPEGLA